MDTAPSPVRVNVVPTVTGVAPEATCGTSRVEPPAIVNAPGSETDVLSTLSVAPLETVIGPLPAALVSLIVSLPPFTSVLLWIF